MHLQITIQYIKYKSLKDSCRIQINSRIIIKQKVVSSINSHSYHCACLYELVVYNYASVYTHICKLALCVPCRIYRTVPTAFVLRNRLGYKDFTNIKTNQRMYMTN